MPDEIVLRRKLERACRAKALLENELLNEVLDQLGADYTKAWRASDPRDREGREIAYLSQAALAIVRSDLKRIVDGGSVAKFELDAIERLNEAKSPD